MNRFEIVTTAEFDGSYKEFGYEEFVRKVLHKCSDKKVYGLIGKITLIDAEISKRIFFKNEEGQEFTVRYFIQDETEKTWSASYTLYRELSEPIKIGEHCTTCSEEISYGCVKTHYIDIKQREEEEAWNEHMEKGKEELEKENKIAKEYFHNLKIGYCPYCGVDGTIETSKGHCDICGWNEEINKNEKTEVNC